MNDLMSSQNLLKRSDEILRQKLSSIYAYLEDASVQEVMVNSPKDIWIERNGQYERLDVQIAPVDLESAITVLSNINGKGKGVFNPVLDCRLPGLRIAATLWPIAVDGASMSIRKHSERVFTLKGYLDQGSLNPRVDIVDASPPELRPDEADITQGREGLAQFFRWMVRARVNFIVSGSTSSGKTALLNALGAHIPDHLRLLTIEDTAEFRHSVPNKVRFEANTAMGVDIRGLTRHALRYRPDLIWVGEVRGAEAFDMLDAYRTGHPGSAVSFHADGAELALARLENMVRMAPEAANWPLDDLRRQIASTFRFLIQASNVAGHRGPAEVVEIKGYENGHYITKQLFKKEFTFTHPEAI
jgi:pilus assembly protein CpaF